MCLSTADGLKTRNELWQLRQISQTECRASVPGMKVRVEYPFTAIKHTLHGGTDGRRIDSGADIRVPQVRIAFNVSQDMISDKDIHTYEAFTDEMVFYQSEPPDPEVDGKKDRRVQVLDDFIEKKLKGFEQAVGRAYVATGGNIDAKRLIKEWKKTRNHFDVTKSVVKKKFMEELAAAEKQRIREKGKT